MARQLKEVKIQTNAPLFFCRLDLHTSNTNLQPSSVTQAIAGKLVSHWGAVRCEAHGDQVSKFYSDKLEVVDAKRACLLYPAV
jgi:tryptophan aminotransferase